MAAMGGGGRLFALYGHEEIFKKSSTLKPWSDFEIISQECSLGDPFQNLFAIFLSVEKHGRHGGGGGGDFLHYMDMKKFLKNLLLRNRWSEFGIISHDRSLCDLF